ncbi:transposase [Actinospica sp. MGRD01-02]|uniref:Transposase n=1 Tax=Actinospica acidithermotolerans TaxID=2828514 RepID=A0A941E3D8_9ACTN|nr:transposase family protein [Actinospica acidithermotolerans]MBR7825455.1 transposase [Actinospica acidithermotolerans]MBR7825975.1 transposase [Actinospica acidithermotolerans]
MVTYVARLNVDPDVVSAIENLVATRRSEIGSPWRALTSFDQAVLYLVWIRHDFTFAELGAHFGVSTDRAWAYATETAEVLADKAPDLAQGLSEAGPERHAVLDGTLIATDRCSSAPAGSAGDNQDPYYSGKHHRHGVNVQGVIGLDGELLFLGEARCGSTHDTAAARADGIIEAAHAADVELVADLGYHGVGGTVRTPVKRKPGRGISPRDQRANREHARVRCRGERGFAQLKVFKVLRRVRISPCRITTLARSIHTVIRLRASPARV